jgi:hypothetical protein
MRLKLFRSHSTKQLSKSEIDVSNGDEELCSRRASVIRQYTYQSDRKYLPARGSPTENGFSDRKAAV